MPVDDEQVKKAQWQFFSRNKSGCAFAAYAAKRPDKYGWSSVVLQVTPSTIGEALASAIADPDVTTLSLIFPEVVTTEALDDLIQACLATDYFTDDGFENQEMRLVRLRARVGADHSWVTGFGPFSFLPLTRQSPHTELTIRVKARPQYDWYFKPPIENVIHLADLNMKGLSDRQLAKLWGASFETTRNILGHAPDEESAAKTTFALPLLRH